MIEIYHGNGKGKTTAAVGLSVRAVGNGLPVIFAQFLKDGSSAEVKVLRQLPDVHYVTADVFNGFAFRMTEEEKSEQRESYLRMLKRLEQMIAEIFPADASQHSGKRSESPSDSASSTAPKGKTEKVRGLLVLDEVLHAVRLGLLPEEQLLLFLDGAPSSLEIVLTGWEPTKNLREKADYITHFQKEKHPYDAGIPARKGVEF